MNLKNFSQYLQACRLTRHIGDWRNITSPLLGEVCFQLEQCAKRQGEGLKIHNWCKFLRKSHPERMRKDPASINKLDCFFPLANDTQSFARQSARNDSNVHSTEKNLVPSKKAFQVSVILNLVQDLDETLKHRGQSDVQGDVRRKLGKMCAFTLAEVLITLGIIGVVAALTIPTVINTYKERVVVTKVKKFYSTMNQALLLSINNNGYADEWNVNSNLQEGVKDMAAYLVPYLKVIRDCGTNINSGCIAQDTYKLLDGSSYYAYDSSDAYYKLILADGSCMWFRITIDYCNTDDGGHSNVCALIWYDINGKQQPNMIGHDTFVFLILKNAVVPHSLVDCNLSSSGFGCASYILSNGNAKYLY